MEIVFAKSKHNNIFTQQLVNIELSVTIQNIRLFINQ
ncbi:hypothetical protein HDC91_000330 [Mucilaginibacter sp. AK015]|nr:hypothetical protein [Mucilaginibacter sp. AK015]